MNYSQKILTLVILLSATFAGLAAQAKTPEEINSDFKQLIGAENTEGLEKYFNDFGEVVFTCTYREKERCAKILIVEGRELQSDEFLRSFRFNLATVKESLSSCEPKNKNGDARQSLECFAGADLRVNRVSLQPGFPETEKLCPIAESQASAKGCFIKKTPVGKLQNDYTLENFEGLDKRFWLGENSKAKVREFLELSVAELKKKKEDGLLAEGKGSEKYAKRSVACKSQKIVALVDANIRIEKDLGKGLYQARLIGIQNYLCGDAVAVAKELPRFFLVEGLVKPQAGFCGRVILKGTNKMKVSDENGFTSEQMKWKVVPKIELAKLPKDISIEKFESNFSYCQEL